MKTEWVSMGPGVTPTPAVKVYVVSDPQGFARSAWHTYEDALAEAKETNGTVKVLAVNYRGRF